MASISAFFRRLFTFRGPRTPPTVVERLSWLLRPYLLGLEDALLWTDPAISACFLVFVNVIIWMLREVGARPLGVLGALILIGALLDAAACALGGPPRSSPRSARCVRPTGSRLSELRACTAAATNRLLTLRREDPAQFCAVMCGSLAIVWVLNRLGGSLLPHAAATLLLSAPLVPHAHLLDLTDSDGEMEGFLPEMSPLAIEELHRAGDSAPSAPPIHLDLPEHVAHDAHLTAALRYAAGEASSSESEGTPPRDFHALHDPRATRTPSLPSTDSSDSDTEFLPKVREVGALPIVGARTASKPEVGAGPGAVVAAVVNEAAGGWLGGLWGLVGRARRAAAPPDSDSDEFELIDQNDL